MLSMRNIITITLLALASASLIDAGIHSQIYKRGKDVKLVPNERFEKFKHINQHAIQYNGKFYYYEGNKIDDTMGFFNEGLLVKIADKEKWKQLKENAKEERFKRFLSRNPKAYIKNGMVCIEGINTPVYDLEGLTRDGLINHIWD